MPPLTLDWLTVIILLGTVQGLVLAAALVSQRRNRTANRLLAVAAFAFSIQMASVVYHAVGLEPVFPHFFGIAYPLPLLYGPLIFLYAVTASDRSRRLQRWDALHWVPFALVVVVGLPIYLRSGPDKVALAQQFQAGVRPLTVRVIDPVKYVSGIAYTVATIGFLQHHRRRIEHSYSSLERVNLGWLMRLTLAGGVIWALATTFHVIDVLADRRLVFEDAVVAVGLAVFVYGIGYMALRQPEIFSAVPGDEGAQPLQTARGASPAEAPTRYGRSGLGSREAAALKEALLTAMERDRPHRDSDLTLTDLAARLGTTPHKLSEVLNSQIGQTFYEFVNGYRVRDVQRRLADSRSDHLTLLALAIDAGFASKSTFNHVFKKQTGQTPSDFRASLTHR